MGQIEDLRLFALVVEHRSISGAANALNIAKSAVSRRLGLLEDRLGVRLIDRAPGVWDVTATGRDLYQRAIRVVTEVEEIDSDFGRGGQTLAGPLAVSLPRDFGIAFLMPALVGFKARHPEIQVIADFDDRRIDLAAENYDLAIRIAPDVERGVVPIRIGSSSHHLCASPAYLDARGIPDDLDALHGHDLLYFGSAKRARWQLTDDAGKSRTIEFHPSLNSNTGAFLLQAAEQGLGIALLPDFICAPAFASGAVVPVLPSLGMPDWGIHIMHTENRRLNRRMRLFIDEMTVVCRGVGARQNL